MEWLIAASAGLLAGFALLAGAIVAWFVRVPTRVVATVMAFGSGVLISALSFDLIEEAADKGFWAAMFGFLSGAIAYVGINLLLDRTKARKRKGRSGSSRAP